MMDMIIKISEKDYNDILNGETKASSLNYTIFHAIKNGTPLPKGHGKLIDVKDLRLDIIAHKYSNSFCEEHNIDQSINVGMLNILLADAPTIIEADNKQ